MRDVGGQPAIFEGGSGWERISGCRVAYPFIRYYPLPPRERSSLFSEKPPLLFVLDSGQEHNYSAMSWISVTRLS